MTKEEWDLKQNSLKKSYSYMPTGVPGQVKKVEASEEDGKDEDGKEEEGEPIVTGKHKEDWNKYLTWLDTKKMRGKPELDKSGLGNQLFGQYIKENPTTSLNSKIIPGIRKEYQKLRQSGIDDIMKGSAYYLGKTGKDADTGSFMKHIELNEQSKDPNYVGQHLTQTYFPDVKIGDEEAVRYNVKEKESLLNK
jgi:hypothetical protein